MKEDSVIKDRDKYIGGSDIPILMGISHFKTRWQLLKEKAEPKGDGYAVEYTSPQIEFGNQMEDKIREYINKKYESKFVPMVKVEGDLRGNCDGIYEDTILEIKTTSIIHKTVDQYKPYLVQLLFYMKLYGKSKGMLAVYERPDDYNTRFKHKRLRIYEINIADYDDLLGEITRQIDRFRKDLAKMKGNPFLTDEDLQPTEIVELADRAMIFETQLRAFKKLEEEYKALKENLKNMMQEKGIKSYIADSGMKVTLVPDGEDVVEYRFDEALFKKENPSLHEMYVRPKTKAGRAGYVKITLPKE